MCQISIIKSHKVYDNPDYFDILTLYPIVHGQHLDNKACHR